MLNDIQATIEQLVAKFDKNPRSTCAKLVKTFMSGQDDDPPSFVLRSVLGSLFRNPSLRTLVPPVTCRLIRCEPKDADVLTHFIASLNQDIQRFHQNSEWTQPHSLYQGGSLRAVNAALKAPAALTVIHSSLPTLLQPFPPMETSTSRDVMENWRLVDGQSSHPLMRPIPVAKALPQ
ncbi:Serine protease family S33 [Phytophthora palmivora]|uniref:Serine protease family S33 n=1 Tax=Phytophthora palmivora TaxID=4796 RepID=A0A2P4X7K8_9STRA|nr:Serine protease family S33 [Phytophthora palmivora]